MIVRHGDALNSFNRLRDRDVGIDLGTDTFPPDLLLNMHVGVRTTRSFERSMRASAAGYYTPPPIVAATRSASPIWIA